MQDETTSNHVLGVDIGGSGMKAAIVDVAVGEPLGDRFRIETPQPATPPAMSAVFAELVSHFDWTGSIGCAFPGVVRRRSVIETAANLDPSWVGVDAAELFGANGSPVVMINDADAAGLAEMRVGAGAAQDGVVCMVTVGTGIGTAIFLDGKLLPNTELGHLEIDGVEAEDRASTRIKKAEDLPMDVWAQRLSRYLQTLEALLSPDAFIVGGGISKKFDEFAPFLETRAAIAPAMLRNHAGIVGAAMAAV